MTHYTPGMVGKKGKNGSFAFKLDISKAYD